MGSAVKNKTLLRGEEKRMSETQEMVLKSDCSTALNPPGSRSCGRKRKEGSVVSAVFYPYPVANIKSPPHANSQASPLSQARETDKSLCVCVCQPPALMDQMAGQESTECLHISPTVY